jgi:hypothetical protein
MVSNNSNNNIYDEKYIENKINEALSRLPLQTLKTEEKKDYVELNLYTIYSNTLNTIIDIINEVILLIEDSKYIDYTIIYRRIYNIIFDENKTFYVGIFLVLLSFVFFFIDGLTI